jgi:putative DNA methylase
VTEHRLIEEYLPVKEVSYESTREKLLRRRDYHISTLHLWWARRPLAAARAAVYAALVPSPEPIDADRAGSFFAGLCAWGGSASAIAEASRQIVEANGGESPKVLDMFAGGGAIPLEATRLGCETTALELNPVAHLVERCTLDYPQRFGLPLANDVRRWGVWLIDHAETEIGDLYPGLIESSGEQTTLDGVTRGAGRVPIAYLWTRTVPCPNPAARPHSVPLVRQTWLVKKKHNYIALRTIVSPNSGTVSYEVVAASSPDKLGFDPEDHSNRGSTTCPYCSASISLDYAREQIRSGAAGRELMAVGLLNASGRGKSYIGSADGRRLVPEERVRSRLASLADEGYSPPDEPIADIPGHTNVYRYGLTKFGNLFTSRQLVMLLTLCRLTREAHSEMLRTGLDPERAKAVATYLGMLIDRMADYHSTLTHWVSTYEKTNNTYARQALPMTWDYSEPNPFGGSSGDLRMHLESIIKVIEHCAAAGRPVTVIRGSATRLPVDDCSQDAVITDPPYYDNIPYADLSDFFYVWLKRSIGPLYPEHLSAPLTPKRAEAIAAPYRHQGDRRAAKAAYEEMMAESFAEAHRVLNPDGVLVCVYAHQTTAGWSTLIEAVRRAGFVVVEAWPLNTEMPTRGVAQGSASLASSIFLVARPRVGHEVGDWAHEVRPELEQIVEERVGDLPGMGVTGTDLVIAAVGAGMRAYTRFERVEKPNGEELSPEEYLQEVEREVSEAILAGIFGTDRRGLGRVDQKTQFYVMGRFEFGTAEIPWDQLNILARGVGVELADLTHGELALVSFGATRDLTHLRGFEYRGQSEELGLGPLSSTIDQLHRTLWLAENEPLKLRDFLLVARPDADKLRLVAHALAKPGLDTSGTVDKEAAACDRLLSVWHKLIEESLFTGGPV